MNLTPEHHSAYLRDGFLLLRELFPQAQLERWSQHFDDIVLGRAGTPGSMVVMKDVMIAKGEVEPRTPLHAISKIMSFEDDPVFWEYVEAPELLSPVRQIVGPELITISSNVFNKPPGIDGRHPLHQDLRYFALRPPDKIIAAWTAIDRATRNSGCLAVLPGSHKRDLYPHRDPDWKHVNRGFFAAEGVELEARVHLEMNPGDTILFHPLLLHGSGRNRSTGFRRAISAHYASTDCVRPNGPRKREPVIRRLPSGPVLQ